MRKRYVRSVRRKREKDHWVECAANIRDRLMCGMKGVACLSEEVTLVRFLSLAYPS